MFHTSISTRTARIEMQVRELNPIAGAPGDALGTFVTDLEQTIKDSDDLKGHFDHCEVSCLEVHPDKLILRYHAGSVHHDVFVSEIKNFIPQCRSYIEFWIGRPLQWLNWSFDVSCGEAEMNYDPLQFELGYLGLQYQESMINGTTLNEHIPVQTQPLGPIFEQRSLMDYIPIVNAAPGEKHVI